MNAAEFRRALERLGACSGPGEAMGWTRGKSLALAWRACERPDWLLWLAARCVPREVLASVVCDVVECVALPYVEDSRPEECLAVVRRWCRGEATGGEVRAASNAALAAAYDAHVAGAAYSARAAADAARAAAYADAAGADAYHAADADAYHAACAARDAADAAAHHAGGATRAAHAAIGIAKRETCSIIRAIVSADDIEAGLRGAR